MIEFDCGDCGVHVYEFGREAPPAPPRCAVCQWLADIADPVEREKLRVFLAQLAAILSVVI